jgi:hypothetical protein
MRFTAGDSSLLHFDIIFEMMRQIGLSEGEKNA